MGDSGHLLWTSHLAGGLVACVVGPPGLARLLVVLGVGWAIVLMLLARSGAAEGPGHRSEPVRPT